MTSHYEELCYDYQRVERAIQFLETHFQEQPSLHQIAAHVHLSEFHFQRLFRRWVGISPKRFLQFLTKEHAKALLDASRNLLDTTYESGLSSPGRLHDLFVACEAVTPGEYKTRGEGVRIAYGVHPTPFGTCLLATTDRGICWLAFVQQDTLKAELDLLSRSWRNALLERDDRRTERFVREIFAGDKPPGGLQLHLRGTNFQIKVWEALLSIPPGQVISYQDLARRVGKERAVRAVANAVARNPVAYLIPCHRVIRKLGDFGGYRGGTVRKKALLGWEMAQTDLHKAKKPAPA
ncbi:MAG: methylated-DNA--[protein]-cysteine S-methyltransferase [Calditrichaeota bacterium]|nr:MAG: methylated-DNA--[protein]-cysteine S-methyltransferase [Calditrichota bacterium]